MGNFNDLVKYVMEADTGVANPTAQATSNAASSIGGSQPTSTKPGFGQVARTRAVDALEKTPLGKASRTAAMAVGAAPMDRWNFPPDASNVYTLDPRGASTQVIQAFQAAIQGQNAGQPQQAQTQEPTTGQAEPATPATESYNKFNSLIKEVEETLGATIENEIDEIETKRGEYADGVAMDYSSKNIELNGSYQYISLTGNTSQVTVVAMPGQTGKLGVEVPPSSVEVQRPNGSFQIAPVINSQWKYSIGPLAGQDVDAPPPEEAIPAGPNIQNPTGPEGEGGVPGETDETDEEMQGVGTTEWIDYRANMLIRARQASPEPYAVPLRDMASGEVQRLTRSKEDQGIDGRELFIKRRWHQNQEPGQIAWKELEQGEQQDWIDRAEQLYQQKLEQGDLNSVHNALRDAFQDKGVYCGTQDQFETFKRGQSGAVADVVKGATNVLKPGTVTGTGAFG